MANYKSSGKRHTQSGVLDAMALAVKQAGIERGFSPNLGWYVALDVETTGLSPKNGDRVIEIGAVAIKDQTIVKDINLKFCRSS